jgi:hypothetical protein
MATENLACDAVTTPNAWPTLVGAASKQAAVAEPVSDGSYIDSDSAGATSQQFSLAAPASIGPSDTINSVSVVSRCARVGSSTNYNVSVETSGGVTTSANIAAGASFVTSTTPLAKPGGGSWTPSDLANLEVRVSSVGTLRVRCSTLYVVVDYTPGAPSVPIPVFQNHLRNQGIQ